MKVSLKFMRRLFVVLVFLLVICFLYVPNYAKICKLKAAREDLRIKSATVREEIKALKEEVSYERIVRDELGGVKKNETVIEVIRD